MWADCVGSYVPFTVVSDRRVKKDINEIDERYFEFFKNLRPVTFKMLNGKSGRTHFGFIAQEVKESAEKANLTTQEIAMYVEFDPRERSEFKDVEGSIASLRYDEFIALNTAMIQKLNNQVEQQEKRISELERKLAELR